MDEFEKELKTDFLTEALSLLDDSEQAFLALEGDKHNADLMNQIFRLAHNLKGTSRAVGFSDVAEFTHEMENLILKVKEGIIPVTDAIVSLLLECNDHITVMIRMLNMDMDAKFDSAEIIVKIHRALSGQLEEASNCKEEVQEEMPTLDEINLLVKNESEISEEVASEDQDENLSAEQMELLANFQSELEGKRKAKEEPKQELKIVHSESAKMEAPAAKAEAPKAKTAQAAKGNEDDNIRVSLSRVENLNNVVGELVILQTVLNQHRTEIDNPLMLKSLSQLAKLSKEIQSLSMSLRMIPLKQTLQKMQRIVRDTSKALNKKVELHLVGEETEIDKTVLEGLSDPLVHIVRNAVDHGLESTEERIAAGKSEAGNVYIRALHEGNNLVIEIVDDGKGINPEIIKKKAIEKGIISATSEMKNEDLINLIFHPGFSTKSEVSEISGRGVGMDVVKTNIEKMNGEVKVISHVGKGSTFRVMLPLTMAIIDGMVTSIGDERYIIPLNQVYESLSPTEENLFHVNGLGECLKIRGEVIPLFKISSILNRKEKAKKSLDQIAIIVNSQEQSFAVLVDDILHQQQVVIKKLGDEIRNQNGFMGSTILGDGRPAIILDLVELFSLMMKKRKTSFSDMAVA